MAAGATGTPPPPIPHPSPHTALLHGCGLPAAWAGQAQWRILATGMGQGLEFLAAWAAWQADPARPRLLHFTACAATFDGASAHAIPPAWQPLARQLQAQCWGLLPGVHRLSFESGRVLLTLCLGDVQTLLRQQQPIADTVLLGAGHLEVHTLKAVARCCRRGTHLAGAAPVAPGLLAQCGFERHGAPGTLGGPALQARFNPAWQPRASKPALPAATVAASGRCLVIGAGLAGAAVAASLARRGWQVAVLDSAPAPAAGASGLPAGVFASHVSPDDSVLSRLSRAGVRTTLHTLAQLPPATQGADWSGCGALEHRVDDSTGLAWASGPGLDWSRPASAAQRAASGLPAGASACWHARGGWVRPPRLIAHLLGQPGIRWQGSAQVARLHNAGTPGAPLWQALDAQGGVLAEAELAVVCAGPHSPALLQAPWRLQPLRGQIAWGLHAQAPAGAPWPPQPLNGHGNLVPHVPLDGGPGWVLGSTFERDQTALPPSAADEAAARTANRDRLHTLAPALGQALAPAFGGPAVRTWAAVRCTAPDRLPLVGPLDAARHPGLWMSTAMGARGLTQALLCGELLAARLHGEPLPLEAQLARALMAERLTAA